MATRGNHVSPTDASVLVTGIVRDCADDLSMEIARLRKALAGFREVRWYIVESDSDDATPDVLQRLGDEIDAFRHASLGRTAKQHPLRTDRLALCRNHYLEAMRGSSEIGGTDYVLIADLDGVNSHLTAEGIGSCFLRDDWDVCCANQLGPYYDVFALRHPDWCPSDCWRSAVYLKQHGLSDEQAKYAAVESRRLVVPPESDWIEVDSAFGGLALYRRSALDNGRYVGLDETGGKTCEHVSLHAALRRSGHRIFINPELINTDGRMRQHGARGLFRRVRNRLRTL